MKKNLLFILLTVLFSCSLNVKNVTKQLLKRNSIDQVTYLRNSVFNNPKISLPEKLEAISAISGSNIKSLELNNFLRDELFIQVKDLTLKKQIFKVISEMNYPENALFFWEQIENSTEYKSIAKSAIAKLGIEGFKIWKVKLLQDNLSTEINSLFIKNDAWIQVLLDFYLEVDIAKKEILQKYLINNENICLNNLVSMINIEKFKKYNEIESLVILFDYKNIQHYDSLFESNSESIFEILKGVYSFYQYNASINLMQLYQKYKDIEIRNKIINLHMFIGSENYLKNLEILISMKTTNEEEVLLIDAIVTLEKKFPDSFVPLLASSDFFFNFEKYLLNYFDKYYLSTENAFKNTSLLGKINIINFLYKNKSNILNKLFLSLDFNGYSTEEEGYLSMIIVLNSISEDTYYPNYKIIFNNMIVLNNPEILNSAILHANKFNFYEDIIANELKKTDISDEKLSILIENLKNTKKDDVLTFLLKKMHYYYSINNMDITLQLASILANNSNFNFELHSQSLSIDDLSESMKVLIASYIISKNINSDEFNDMFIDKFFQFSDTDRIRIVDYTKRTKQNKILSFLLINYDNLTFDEKSIVNASLINFAPSKQIISHLQRLVIFGNNENIDFVENYIAEGSVISAKLIASLKRKFFLMNDFDRYSNLNLSKVNPVDSIMMGVAQIYQNSEIYNQRYSNKDIINQSYPNRVIKSVIDSLVFCDELLNNELIFLNKVNLKYRKAKYLAEYNKLLPKYSNFCTDIELEEENFQSAFFVNIKSCYSSNELKVGNVSLFPEKDNQFLTFLIEFTNKGLNDIEFFENDLHLQTKDNFFNISKKGEVYFNHMKRINPTIIKTNTTAYINVIYEVGYKEFDINLIYNASEGIQIIEPISIVPQQKEYIDGILKNDKNLESIKLNPVLPSSFFQKCKQ